MNNQLLKAKDVAERLNVSRSQAFVLMRDEELPTVRFGRCVRVRTEDLEKFIQLKSTDHKTNLLNAELTARTASSENHQANRLHKEINHV
jgi:excisionase family DNA binding protein